MTHTQQHINGITLLSSQHSLIRRLKRDHPVSIHGNKFWGSSFLLMEYLTANRLKKHTKVLELGCGWGAASLFCAKIMQAKVTAVDADSNVFPYLETHAKLNKVTVKTLTKRFEKVTTKELAEYDIIIGADICFWDELNPTLFNLFRRAQRAGVKTIIIADPEREPFLDLCIRCAETFDNVDIIDQVTNQPRRLTGSLLIINNQ